MMNLATISTKSEGKGGMTASMDPILISIRPTLTCNFSCSFCLSSSGNRRKEQSSWKEIEEFFRQLDKANFNGELHICGGEPFVYRKIDKLIVESSKHVPRLSVLTNASWIPQVQSSKLQMRKLYERLLMVKNLSNTTLRLSMDTYHFDGENGKTVNPKGPMRLATFIAAARDVGLKSNVHYQVMVTEKTLEDALKTKEMLIGALRLQGEDCTFIKTRGMYKLGQAREGKTFRIGDSNYVAINPTLDGTLIVYAGRQEETAGIVYGPVNKLCEVIEKHRMANTAMKYTG